MNSKTNYVLRNIFHKYYSTNTVNIELPKLISNREFGYVPFDGKMVRHLSFKTHEELIDFLIQKSPLAVYMSNAYYNFPTKPMMNKDWLSCDLVFDIDADAIPTKCKKNHDVWRCNKCNFMGKGIKPVKCNCGFNIISQIHWYCEICLSAAKFEVIKLIDFLINDFGVNQKELKIHFSGHRGYHVTINNDIFNSLSRMARNEISDYLKGVGFITEMMGLTKYSNFKTDYSQIHDATYPGWYGRISTSFNNLSSDLVGNNDVIKDKIAYFFSHNKYSKFTKYIEKVVNQLSVNIDSSVTTDIHRIFRLSGTLHGKSGLLKSLINNIDDFDPFTDPVAFDDEQIVVKVIFPREFVLNEQKFKVNIGVISLPKMAAVYLLCGGFAIID